MRVLSIDGGGIRGLIPALVLQEVERRTGRPTADLFDYMAGTSTGGILVCALARPTALSAGELVSLYEEEGPRIFRRGLLKRVLSVEGLVDERYDDDGLVAALERYLDDAHLRDVRPDILVTAYDITDRFAFLFRSARARTDPTHDFALRDVARATAAAPTYFEPALVTDAAGARSYPLIDGGIYAVNPGMCALAELSGREPTVMASLGTGQSTRPYAYERARRWGQLEWARPLVDMVFDGTADTTEFQLAALLGNRYVRLQTRLDDASDDLDDASEENLAALRREGERLIAARSADIDALCATLTA